MKLLALIISSLTSNNWYKVMTCSVFEISVYLPEPCRKITEAELILLLCLTMCSVPNDILTF